MKWLLAASAGLWLIPGCKEKCVPILEICDNLDNDCNGEIDDGLRRICEGPCGLGEQVCSAGEWSHCSARAPTEEICDKLDNDCDACTDEGDLDCTPLARPCETACGDGIESCYMGIWRGCTAVAPADEMCDTVDNDCDGSTDEELDRDQDGDAHFSPDSCSRPNDDCDDSDGAVFPGHREDCDGKDNDCDLIVDEGCSCIAPSQQECGLDEGLCRHGTQACQADGTWGDCLDAEGKPVFLPSALPEICDLQDNDCDGLTDEGNPEGDSACGSSVGACKPGVLVCKAGALLCDGATEPSEEVCNPFGEARDDDCDGLTDEGLAGDGTEPNNDCSEAQALGPLDTLRQNLLAAEGTIYRFEANANQPDHDFYCVFAEETLATCLENQCLVLTARLQLPAGSDHTRFALCLTDLGPAAAPATCGDRCAAPVAEICSDPVADWQPGFYQISFSWAGLCLQSDSRFFAVSVRTVGDLPVVICDPYKLTLGLDKLEQRCPGT